jgi:hypothetical protein
MTAGSPMTPAPPRRPLNYSSGKAPIGAPSKAGWTVRLLREADQKIAIGVIVVVSARLRTAAGLYRPPLFQSGTGHHRRRYPQR